MLPKLILRPTALAGRSRFALTVMSCALGFSGSALADDCQGGATPLEAAGTAALFNQLAKNGGVEPLALSIANRARSGTCAWVYEVKVLTASGNVAVLDFDLVSLDLTRVDGPAGDPEIARLLTRLESVSVDRYRIPADEPRSPPGGKSVDSGGSADGGGSGNSGSGSSGGNSGSGGSGSGGSGSSGSGSGGSGGEGGEGGDGGDGGEGGEGGDGD